MTTTDGGPATVISRDGTEIAFWTSGSGPPLVLLHGTGSVRGTWAPLLPHLEPHVTVHAVDRRGRGSSGDAPVYDVRRELEDVVAVVDGLDERAGVPVALLGHSFGGYCALKGAALTSNVARLVLYEPDIGSGGSEVSPDLPDRLETILARGDRDGMLETFLREAVLLSQEEVGSLRAIPEWWDVRTAVAHTIPRELRATAAAFDPEDVAGVSAPTLLLLGGDSPASVRADTHTLADALPDARVTVLEGQQHMAHALAPEYFAAHVLQFLHGWLGL